MGHPRSVALSGNAGSFTGSLRGAEVPLFHGRAGVCDRISERRPSGAKARIEAALIAARLSAAPPKRT